MGITPITVPPALATVLNTAGDKSGVDFGYLLQTAIRESSLNPSAKAPSSSAVGLFQFLDSTWLEVMKSDGGRLGYQAYADAIVERGGEYTIDDKKLRAEVLKLREDPQVAADLAAAFTRNNGAYLQEKFGRMPSPGELYIAHFLGSKGAEKMFVAGLKDSSQIAATLFPKQAKANPGIFYEHGKARTIKEVYQALVAKHISPGAVPSTTDPNFAVQQMASQQGNIPLPLPAPLEVPGTQSPLAVAPGEAPVPVASNVAPQPKWMGDPIPSRFAPAGTAFASLFSPPDAEPAPPRTLLTPSSPAQEAGGPAPFFSGLFGH